MASLPQVLIAPAKATVTPPRDLLSPTSAEDHGKAFAEALAQARGKAEGRRRAESRPVRDDAAQPAGVPVTGHVKHTTPEVEHAEHVSETGEESDVDPAQGAVHGQAAEHAAEQAFSSQGVPFRDAQAPADAVTTPAPVEGVEVAPSVTVGAAPAPPAEVAAPAASELTTPLEGTSIDPTVPPAPPTGEASATGRAAGTTTDLSNPVDGRATDATGSTPPATGPVVDGNAIAETAVAIDGGRAASPSTSPGGAAADGTRPLATDAAGATDDGRAASAASDQSRPLATDAQTATSAGADADHGPKDGHADHGRHLGQAAHAQEGQPLLVGKDLGAAGGQHLGRTAGPRSEAVEPAAPAGPTVTGLAATPSTQATTASSSTPATAAAPVAVPDQLFASLGRLVRRGDGTHRLTIKLQPEALGEVRVVLTVRDGDVSVKLSGSDAAQRALLQGASDLQRLLESVGAKTAQVVVGDASQQSAGWNGLAGQSSQSDTGRQGGDRTAPSYARPEHTAPDPTLTRARNRQSVLDVTV